MTPNYEPGYDPDTHTPRTVTCTVCGKTKVKLKALNDELLAFKAVCRPCGLLLFWRAGNCQRRHRDHEQ